MDKRTKVLFAFFIIALVVIGGTVYFSHNQAKPVVGPENGTIIQVEPASYVGEGKEVAFFGGYVTAKIYTDLVKTSDGNLYEQTIFVCAYAKESFNVMVETLGGELLNKLTIGDNEGYDIKSIHCVSPDPAVIITVKHGSKIEQAMLVSDVIRK